MAGFAHHRQIAVLFSLILFPLKSHRVHSIRISEDYQVLKQCKSTNLDYLNKLTKLDLLVIDDFGLMDLDLDKCRDLFEVLYTRDGRKSTVGSQVLIEGTKVTKSRAMIIATK